MNVAAALTRDMQLFDIELAHLQPSARLRNDSESDHRVQSS